MSYRNEEKLRVAAGKIFQLKKWINESGGNILYPSRTVNSIYFDNEDYSMYSQSIEGVTPRKKIRFRIYNNDFFLKMDEKINKEVKITSVEGRFKTSNEVKDPINLMKLGIYDNNYGICFPILNVIYKRSYYLLKDIRLTIDEKITYKKIINGQISKLSTFDNYSIIELKYSNKQLLDTVSKIFPFERIRFSKYCRGVEFLKLNYCNEV